MGLSNLKTKYMTRNDCYTDGRKITPKGIMVHSTATPGVMAADWFSRWNKSYKAGEINRKSASMPSWMIKKSGNTYLGITEAGMQEEKQMIPTSVSRYVSRVGFLIQVDQPWSATM